MEVPFRADTVTWCRHAQPRPRRAGKGEGGAFKRADGGGLYPYLTLASAKSWRYDYRFNRRRRTLAFGLYPALSLAAARAGGAPLPGAAPIGRWRRSGGQEEAEHRRYHHDEAEHRLITSISGATQPPPARRTDAEFRRGECARYLRAPAPGH
ncbi:MAG: Arm DNA-binding domain-containing protein [Steroidobacteraceae bacterium]